MLMKNLVLFMLAILLVGGCDTKRESIGGDNEIVVITAPESKQMIGSVLRAIFTDTVFTPQPEPVYELKFANPEGFTKLQRQTNLVIGSIGDDLTNPGTKLVHQLLGEEKFTETLAGDQHIIFTRDQFAGNQLFMIISAASLIDFEKEITAKSKWIRKTFDEKYESRQKKYLFGSTRQKKIEKRFLSDYGWTINIPWGWVIIKEIPDSNFVWLGREMPYQWLSVQWEDGLTTHDSLTAAEKLWQYPESFYKSIRFNSYKYSMMETSFNHWSGWKAVGIWESIEDALGGPFVSYLFYDGITDRTYKINMIVHYPQKEKTVYLRQLELIAKSFRVIEQ